MKKILLSTIVLTAFSLSIVLFQLSCKKEAKAQSTQSVVQQGKIIFVKSGTPLSLWIANYDGSDQQEIQLALPVGSSVDGISSISPDRKTLFVPVYNGSGDDIYTCNVDGSNLKKIISNAGSNVTSY
jgi:hypothetical protein